MAFPIDAVLINPGDEDRWLAELRRPDAHFSVDISQNVDKDSITWALVGRFSEGDLLNYPNLRIIQSLWAGVDRILSDNSIPQHIPIVRMVDPSLTQGMVDYVICQVMNIMLRTSQYNSLDWKHDQRLRPRYRKDLTIGFLGFGVLAQACANSLDSLGFSVMGWGRSAKNIADVDYFFGNNQLDEFLANTHILVNLLPNTQHTQNLINKRIFSKLPQGAAFINVGRGEQLVEEDLITALESGHLSECVLDVFREEPLPAEHPFWFHPRIIISPHIASVTNPRTAAQVISQNIERWQNDHELHPIVNRQQGY